MAPITANTDLPLPVELIRHIFELAAAEDSACSIKFALVSSWVRDWMDSVMYKTVALNFPISKNTLFMRTLESKSPEFFARTVKNLYMSTTISFDDAQKIISVCGGAKRITCWASTPYESEPGLFQNLPSDEIQQLSIKIETLEIVNPPALRSKISVDWDWLCLLPNLTHLALGEVCAGSHKHLVDIIQRLLVGCQSLEMLVVICQETEFIDLLTDTGLADCDEVVVLPHFYSPAKSELEYWECAERGEWDLWRGAKTVIDERRTEVVQPDGVTGDL